MRVPKLSASAITMLSNIFKKNETPSPLTVPASGSAGASTVEQITAQLADKTAWEGKVQAALGDDAALLAIAKESPLIDIKHAAVEALVSEDALKRAEREFRDHDRRVHRIAKQRYETLVNRRVAAVSAAKLIETAAVLIHEPSIPANRLVELDRAWQALDQTMLDDKQVADYLAIWTKLSALTRERGEQQLHVKRWLADAEPALSNLMAVATEVADGTAERSALAVARQQVETVLAAAPQALADTKANTQTALLEARSAALQVAIELAVAVDERIAALEQLRELPQPAAATDTTIEVVGTADATPLSRPVSASPASRWRALSAVNDAPIAALLDARFAEWQSAKSAARQTRTAEAKQHAKAETEAAKQARSEALAVVVTALVEKAEAALADGHVTECTKALTAIDDAATSAKGASIEKMLRARIETLQAETARLKGWQHWGGGRVRDDLVVEAEALATASTAEKIAIKQHADAIENLRNRWKELDKLGGATSRPLWQRFDAALKTAYQPVAVHLSKLKAVRQENLAARKVLIDNLDAVKLTAEIVDATTDSTPGDAVDLRALARALEHFQTEWRKCGPVEHTVPHKAQTGLVARMKASIARLDAPLSEARRVAQIEREKLIVRANALAADPKNRDVITKVRELQTEWQAHAKTLPLMRQIENALWTQFKTATDAVFKARDALHAARDTEFKANQVARDALIARLAAINADTAPAEIKRTLADVDAEWRKCGDAARSETAKLDANFRAARDAAQQYLAGSAKRGWNIVCDTLDAKLALCVEAESAGAPTDVATRWSSLPALPTVWEKALSARLASAKNEVDAGSLEDDADDTDDVNEIIATPLLQLESALEIESPPAFQAARRDLKLRAMKAAIEGRQSATTTNTDIERWLAEVIAQVNVDATSKARINTIIAAIRNKPLR